jgi:NAD+ kinase
MKRVALYENQDKPKAIEFALKTIEILNNLGTDCIVTPSLAIYVDNDYKSYIQVHDVEEFYKYADAVVSFGGDGTLLTVAREMLLSEVPIMGFNVGKLGFLAEYSVDNLDASISELLDGHYRLVDRSVLETIIDGKIIYALNDFVIEKINTSKMITVNTYSDQHFVGEYRADGLIITTPTGSTAYSLSCSGPIIAPSAKVICLTPISPHTLTIRPLVVPDANEITLELSDNGEGAILVADGITIKSVEPSDKISFKISNLKVKLIKPLKSSYYDVLRNKFLWASNSSDIPSGH